MALALLGGLFLFAWLGLASVGHRFWVHRLYLWLLMKVFEKTRKRIKRVDKKKTERVRKLSKINEVYEEVDDDDTGDDFANQVFATLNGDINKNRSNNHLTVPIADQNGGPKMVTATATRRQRTMTLGLSDTCKKEFDIADIADFVRAGVQAIVDDHVTKRFAAEELKTWNLLTRTDKYYHYESLRLAIIWNVGLMIRYLILLPVRFTITAIGILWLVVVTYLIGCIPESAIKRWIYGRMSIMCFRILSRGFSGYINFHNVENRPSGPGICVANHTSPIDVVILHCDNAYALVGQRQPGLLGLLQRALGRANHHIWFERFEVKDREAVTKRLSDHSSDPTKLPILIFPEGTCINNSAVMQFKKGSFEVGGKIYPVAIKYNPVFGDPFWDSSKYGYARYLLMMMTSWAIVCDIWYLPSMAMEPGESAIEFAGRVKSKIAAAGGLVDLDWDGQLKRIKVKPEWLENQQYKFSQRIKLE